MLVIPDFDSDGRLPAGIHTAPWSEIVFRLGFTARRKQLLLGLRDGLTLLRAAGCRLAYLDGSFVTSRPEPGDFDACWGIAGVDVEKLDPVFLDFANARARQKHRFLGEFSPPRSPRA